MSEPNIPHQIARAIKAHAKQARADAVRRNYFPIPEDAARIAGMLEAAGIAAKFKAGSGPPEPESDLGRAMLSVRIHMIGMTPEERLEVLANIGEDYCQSCGYETDGKCYCEADE